jgi:hypothetical protein
MRGYTRAARATAAAALLGSGLIGITGVFGDAPPAAAATGTPAPTQSTCHLGNGIQHVIHITFDNVHFHRDNPNVLSDLEQMPNLYGFLTSNGALLSNSHTPLIAHTSNDSLTQYSGMYGDRAGMPIGNNFEYYTGSTGNENGTAATEADSFVYWSSPIIDHGPQTPSAVDLNPSMVYSAGDPPASVASSTGHDAVSPVPWATFTKAGCNVGDFSSANMVLEKYADIPTVFGAGSPEAQQVAADTGDSFKDAEVDDYLGETIHCAQDPASGTPDPMCSTAKAFKYDGTQANKTATTATNSAVAESLPDQPGGYSGFQMVDGYRYVDPILAGGGSTGVPQANLSFNGYPVTDAQGNLTDINGSTIFGAFKDKHGSQATAQFNPGFPGFSPTAAISLAYIADMQEAGIPVTYTYIADSHEKRTPNGSTTQQTGCGSPGKAMGPGDTCYSANLAADDAAFGKFFDRLTKDGITPSNTLFMISNEESDFFAGANVGRALAPTCSGTPDTIGYSCTYTATTVGENSVNVHGLLTNQEGDSTPFYSEPQGESMFVTGNQSLATVRQFQRDVGTATVQNTYDGVNNQPIATYMSDPTTEQLLHFANADPTRTPTLTIFPPGDDFFSSGTSDSCGAGTTAVNANVNCRSINDGFAWNHGYYNPRVDITWLGIVGPGVAVKGVDGPGPSVRPDASQTVPQQSTTGTFADETDMRVTMFALLGLKDTYQLDGRVLTEDMTVTPHDTGNALYQPYAQCYKQLNASVGRFGTDILQGDTTALKSGSAGDDSQYTSWSAAEASLGTQRDTLAQTMKNQLDNAEYGSGFTGTASSELDQCNNVLNAADALASGTTQSPVLPEAPWAAALPVLGLVVGALALLVMRRRRLGRRAT